MDDCMALIEASEKVGHFGYREVGVLGLGICTMAMLKWEGLWLLLTLSDRSCCFDCLV